MNGQTKLILTSWRQFDIGPGTGSSGFPSILVTFGGMYVAFHLYIRFWPYTAIIRRPSISFVLVLFLLYPASPKFSKEEVPWYDYLLAAIGAFVTLYLVIEFDSLITRSGLPTRMDLVVAFLGVAILLEATRRVTSPVLPIIAIFFLFYCIMVDISPRSQHRGFNINRIVNHIFLGTEGIFGIPLGVSATFVFMFILFGSVLEQTGMGKFIIDLSMALAGWSTGGPAKVAVVSSGLMGSISLFSCECLYYRYVHHPVDEKCRVQTSLWAVEAVASTGGLICPVMGAAAFIMARLWEFPMFRLP